MAAISGLSGQNAEDLKLNYLKLLVAQLQYQNPLEPMDNAEMTSQLAQISQVEHLEAIRSGFGDALQAAQGRYAADLIGKEISFIPNGELEARAERVDAVEAEAGKFYVKAGDYLVALDAIRTIRD